MALPLSSVGNGRFLRHSVVYIYDSQVQVPEPGSCGRLRTRGTMSRQGLEFSLNHRRDIADTCCTSAVFDHAVFRKCMHLVKNAIVIGAGHTVVAHTVG